MGCSNLYLVHCNLTLGKRVAWYGGWEEAIVNMIVQGGCYWHRYLYLPVEKPEFHQGVLSRLISLFHLWVPDEVVSCWEGANVWVLPIFQCIWLMEPAGSKVDVAFVVSIRPSNCPWLVCHVLQTGLTIRRQNLMATTAKHGNTMQLASWIVSDIRSI